jgi:pimeloyl-ACP methyl ester carboxylesterase
VESGAGADATEWQAVQPALSRMTRTCSYGRAGTGSSVARGGVRDAHDEIADLERLLARVGGSTPYVIVGHSFGGVIARAYAGEHPVQTAARVLIDSAGPNGRRRQLAIWPKHEAPERRRQLATTVLDGDLAATEALADRTTTLASLADATRRVAEHGPHHETHLVCQRVFGAATVRYVTLAQPESASSPNARGSPLMGVLAGSLRPR